MLVIVSICIVIAANVLLAIFSSTTNALYSTELKNVKNPTILAPNMVAMPYLITWNMEFSFL